MLLERWDPIRELRRAQYRFDHFGRGLRPAAEAPNGSADRWRIPLDVVQEDDEVLVHAGLPGVKPEDISVTIEDGVLTVRGSTESGNERKDGQYLVRERRAGSFHRSVRLPDTVDPDNATSAYENGVVTISIPRAESKKARKLTVEVKDGGKALSGKK